MSTGNVPLARMDPRPISSPSLANHDGAPARPSRTSSVPNIGLQLGPEAQIPDHPHSMSDVPRPSNKYGDASARPGRPGRGDRPYDRPHDRPHDGGYGHQHHQQTGYDHPQQQQMGYGGSGGEMATSVSQLPTDVASLKSRCRFQLREYLSLQRRRQRADDGAAGKAPSYEAEARIRAQQGVALAELVALQREVKAMVKTAENHRWRKWLLGGAIASFIPLVRRIFRRGDDEASRAASNDTEYAFNRSKGLLDYIKDGVLGNGSFAKVAFFVFAVLYVFQNEVSLRVARTTYKRVKRLVARVEAGDPDLDEGDVEMLEGWRWRILLW